MEDTNKFLTEAMGECWHEWPNRSTPCVKCGQRSSMSDIGMHNNFMTWGGFGKLWEWAIKQEWWQKFLNIHNVSPDFRFRGFDTDLINPEQFAKAVFLYLKSEPPKEGE